MSDFQVRSDSVDVEQIMRQIRARIREKRGADYTEVELRELATVKLEKFLDPAGVRSDLVDQFRRQRVASPELPKYEFEDTTLYETHRGALRFVRKLLHPLLKLFINPNPLIHAMHVQAQVNDEIHKRFRQREEMDPLYYEVVHNLVMEVTRLGIDVHNMKMRVESLSSRLDFDERRGRSLESVVEYRRQPVARQEQAPNPSTGAPVPAPSSGGGRPEPRGETGRAQAGRPQSGRPDVVRVEGAPPESAPGDPGRTDADGERRRRRRRRRRRPGQTFADQQGDCRNPGGDDVDSSRPGDASENSGEKTDATDDSAWANEGGHVDAPARENGSPAPAAPAASESAPTAGAGVGPRANESVSRDAAASGGGPPSHGPDSGPSSGELGRSLGEGQAPRPFDEAQGRAERVEGRATNVGDGDSDQ
jgi:hypothetical protein